MLNLEPFFLTLSLDPEGEPCQVLPLVLGPPQHYSNFQLFVFPSTLGCSNTSGPCRTFHLPIVLKPQTKLNCKNEFFLCISRPHGSPDYLLQPGAFVFVFLFLFPARTGLNTSLLSTSAHKFAWAHLSIPWTPCAKHLVKILFFNEERFP